VVRRRPSALALAHQPEDLHPRTRHRGRLAVTPLQLVHRFRPVHRADPPSHEALPPRGAPSPAQSAPPLRALGISGSYRLRAESFRRSLLAENKDAKTIKTYTEGVRLLGVFLAERGMPTEIAHIRREHVESFVGDQLELCKPNTALNRYRALTVAFGWLIDECEIKRSPMANMKPPHVPEEPPGVLTDAQLRRLLRRATGEISPRGGTRRSSAYCWIRACGEVNALH
jgi:hypothetical protein